MSNKPENNTKPQQNKLHITLEGIAAQNVTQLKHVEIPNLWHVAHWPELKADRDAIVLIWHVAHNLQDELNRISAEGGRQ